MESYVCCKVDSVLEKKKYKFDLSIKFFSLNTGTVSMSTCGFKTLTRYVQLHSQFGKYLIHQFAFHKLRTPHKTRPVGNYRDTTDMYTPVSSFHAT